MIDIHPSHFAADPAFTTRFAPLSAVAAATAYTDSLAKPSAWTAVTFQNGWANYGINEQTAQYRKVGDMVQVRGTVKNGTVGFVPVFTLPIGFRPPGAMPFTTFSNGLVTGLYVTSGGLVEIYTGSNVSPTVTCQFSVTA